MADVTEITFTSDFGNITLVILVELVLMTVVFFIYLIQIERSQLSLIDRIDEMLYEITPFHVLIAVDIKFIK